MDFESFIKGLSQNVLMDTPIELLGKQTEYMELEDWTSMTAFTLISWIESTFGKKLFLPELLNAQTLEDLFNIVNN